MRNHPLYHEVVEGSLRVFRWSKKWANSAKDYVAPEGWRAIAYQSETSPVSGKLLPMPQWWITEIKVGGKHA